MELAEVLARAFGAPVVVHETAPNVYQSTFESRVAECEVGGERVVVIVKSGPSGAGSGYGHRGGVTREVETYRELLAPHGLGARFFGAVEDGGSTWLVLEYIADATRLTHSDDSCLVAAARWAGEFHARYERAQPAHVPVYDRAYYLGWARRARELWSESVEGVEPACACFEASVDALLAAPQTVIHGELGPNNVLVSGERVCPVDWESAAVGPGEVDLALLVQHWPEPWRSDALSAYRAARWPAGAPEHDEASAAADLYWLMRWLGDDELWRVESDPAGQVATLIAEHEARTVAS